MRQALGRGIDALIRKTNTPNTAETAPATSSNSTVAIHKIKPNRYQPRRVFNDESLNELAQSIKKHGLTQPIAVTKLPVGDSYELIAGERRWRAARLAGLTEIPCVVHHNLSNEQMLALSLIENIQREDLNAIDTALAFRQLTEEFKISQAEIAEYCGKSKSTVSNSLRLLELEYDMQKAVQSGSITEGHARTLLSVGDKHKRRHIFELAMEKKMSVRQLEDTCRQASGLIKKHTKRSAKTPDIIAFESSLQTSLGTKVEVRPSKNHRSGTLLLHYHSFEELNRLSAKLMGHK